MYSRKTRKRGPIKRFAKGRVCKKFKCQQRLSIYNSNDYCNVHHKESLG